MKSPRPRPDRPARPLPSATVDQKLRHHSNERTATASLNAIPPIAVPDKPSELWVMFSYAWLEDGPVAKQQHRVQDAFFKELERQLKYKPETYVDLPPIRLWRDQHQIRKINQGAPQILDACERAFLGLIMLSDKYPHSQGCMIEADYFLTKTGEKRGQELSDRSC
jgi:hypothetical protein